jgi:hypothetical protein
VESGVGGKVKNKALEDLLFAFICLSMAQMSLSSGDRKAPFDLLDRLEGHLFQGLAVLLGCLAITRKSGAARLERTISYLCFSLGVIGLCVVVVKTVVPLVTK